MILTIFGGRPLYDIDNKQRINAVQFGSFKARASRIVACFKITNVKLCILSTMHEVTAILNLGSHLGLYLR